MRETNFIAQNREKWGDFEDNLRSSQKDPDALIRQFVEITDDLSYARTFYPNRSVRVYLNSVAQRVFFMVNRERRYDLRSRFVRFWANDLPQLAWESRREMLLSFLVFVLAFMIGAVSSAINPEFVRSILGDAYVNRTLDNIANGDPMAVYKDPDATGMALQITWNNLRVALLIFLFGLVFSAGSLALILSNGIMVGAFQYFFFQQGVFWDSFLTIWIHGTLEMSTMVIAGAAGILLGKGLVFPGTYTRLQAFMLSGRRGLTLMLGIAPLVVLAGFIESFVTRFTDAPYVLRGLFIFMSLAFVLFYFGWYPRRVSRRERPAEEDEVRLPPTPDYSIDYTRVKGAGQMFTDAFAFYRRHLGFLLRAAAGMALVLTAALISWQWYQGGVYHDFGEDDAYSAFSTDIFKYFFRYVIGQNISNVLTIWGGGDFFSLGSLLNWLQLSVLTIYFFHRVSTDAGRQPVNRLVYALRTGLAGIGCSALVLYFFSLDGGFTFLLFFGLTPLVLLWSFMTVHEESNPLNTLGLAFSLRSGWMDFMGLYLAALLMAFVIVVLVMTPLSMLYLEFLASNLSASPDTLLLIQKCFYTFLYFLGIGLAYPLLLLSAGIGYFSLREIREAPGLMAKIPQVGVRRRSYGLEQE